MVADICPFRYRVSLEISWCEMALYQIENWVYTVNEWMPLRCKPVLIILIIGNRCEVSMNCSIVSGEPASGFAY